MDIGQSLVKWLALSVRKYNRQTHNILAHKNIPVRCEINHFFSLSTAVYKRAITTHFVLYRPSFYFCGDSSVSAKQSSEKQARSGKLVQIVRTILYYATKSFFDKFNSRFKWVFLCKIDSIL
jgi:hypothetical protein